MRDIKNRVREFLNKYNMNYENIEYEKELNIFIEEMSIGLNSNESSLEMLPTYLNINKEIPINEPIIVMDAGGTNFRVAKVMFDENMRAHIEDYKLYKMPGTNGEITKDEFFKAIACYLEPIIEKSNKIGFCFSYPTEILSNRDGRLIQFSKEVKVKDLEGECIGEGIVNKLKALGLSFEKEIVLLNDTVATLIGGKASYTDRAFDSYIGFILGTGTNICYIEDITNIKKIRGCFNNDSMLINIESGGYSKFNRGLLDVEFDSNTKDFSKHQLEKMVSGKYLGGLILAVLKKATLEGLFSDEFCKGINSLDDLTTEEVSCFLSNPYANNKLEAFLEYESNDYITLFYIIDAIIERAAKLTAISLGAIMVKTNKGKNPCRPVCITADGSTFYKLKSFREKLDFYMKYYMNDKMGYYYEFVKSENANLVGAAIAGLL